MLGRNSAFSFQRRQLSFILRPDLTKLEFEEPVKPPTKRKKGIKSPGKERFTVQDALKMKTLKDQGLTWKWTSYSLSSDDRQIAEHFPGYDAENLSSRYYKRLKSLGDTFTDEEVQYCLDWGNCRGIVWGSWWRSIGKSFGMILGMRWGKVGRVVRKLRKRI